MTKKPARAPVRAARNRPNSAPAEEPTPAERLADLERRAAAAGIKPLDDAILDAMGDVWPANENVDDFLAWLRQSRRTAGTA